MDGIVPIEGWANFDEEIQRLEKNLHKIASEMQVIKTSPKQS